jgi:Glycosyltransferase like family 2
VGDLADGRSEAFSYVLPLRMAEGAGTREELTRYLTQLTKWCDDVIVADGSTTRVFADSSRRWSSLVRHITPDPARPCPNGKVAGVLTGLDHARHERVVIADDDVRYDQQALARVVELLDENDLVAPQNFFSPLPWHAVWDTARTLLNRTVGDDFPGTLGVRRSTLQSIGGYSGEVLFENLELIRTVEAHGGRIVWAPDLWVRRLPPTTTQFLGQRTRQAYDDLGIPWRMTLWLSIVPGLVASFRRGHVRAVLAIAGGCVVVAEAGRRRAGGTEVFPAAASALAPLWILERGCCAWLAILERVRFGGVRYGDGVIRVSVHSKRYLRRRRDALD